MIAFEKAKEMGADWIELDVQETKDGKIVVIHDSNLKRTTGINKNVWDVSYDKIKDLDAGSFLDKKYSDARIPLLEDVVKWAKKNYIKLNIELKPNGHEKNLESEVIDIILENDFIDNCVLTSQTYYILTNIKNYNKDIKTIYVMSVAFGSITNIDNADHFSVEASNVNKSLVNNIHKNGKELYVWTVNNETNIKKMLDYNVDNIITDNIELTKKLIDENKTSNIILEYIKIVENILG